MRGHDHPERDVERGPQMPRGEEQHGDDAHRLLGVVGAVPQAVGGGGDELRPPEDPVHAARRRATERPHGGEHEREADREPDEGRQDHEHADLDQPAGDERAESALRHRGARESADERMRGARRQAPVPGDEVPRDRADETCEDDPLVHRGRMHHAFADRGRHADAEAERGDEVEERRPHHRLQRRQDARGDDGGDGVGGVVKAVDEIEDECHEDDEDDDGQHGDRTLRLTPS